MNNSTKEKVIYDPVFGEIYQVDYEELDFLITLRIDALPHDKVSEINAYFITNWRKFREAKVKNKMKNQDIFHEYIQTENEPSLLLSFGYGY